MADENDQVETEEEEQTTAPKVPYSQRLKLNGDEFDSSTKVSRSKALQLLIQRLPKTHVYNELIPHVPGAGLSLNTDESGSFFGGNRGPTTGAPARAVIAKKILEAIPEDMLTEELLTEGDIRPFMLSIVSDTDPEKGGQVGKENVTVQDRAVISWMMQDETEQIQMNVEMAMVSVLDPSSPTYTEDLEQARTSARNYSMGYRDGEVNRVGLYQSKDGKFVDEQKTGLSAAEQFARDAKGAAGVGQTPYRFLSGQLLQQMLQSDEITFDQMIAMQNQPVKRYDEFGNVTTVDKIDGARITYSPDMVPVPRSGPHDPTIPTRKDWYSVSEIMRKPFDMTREEAANIYTKMKKAGIFDLVGGEPQLEGDPTDPQFQKAWKALATMSLESNKPMTSILEERESGYQASLEAALAISLTDPARLRINGDAFARDAIGRKLSPDEQSQMVKFLHDLERQNARISAGLDVTATGEEIEGVEALDEGITADIDAQMEEWLVRNNPGEAGARDIAEQYDTFARLLGGPGRGVS